MMLSAHRRPLSTHPKLVSRARVASGPRNAYSRPRLYTSSDRKALATRPSNVTHRATAKTLATRPSNVVAATPKKHPQSAPPLSIGGCASAAPPASFPRLRLPPNIRFLERDLEPPGELRGGGCRSAAPVGGACQRCLSPPAPPNSRRLPSLLAAPTHHPRGREGREGGEEEEEEENRR